MPRVPRGGNGTSGGLSLPANRQEENRVRSHGKWLLIACMALVSGLATAKGGDTTPEPLETVSVLTLDGQIVIEPDGHVSDVSIDTKLAPTLAGMVRRHVLAWRFKPVSFGGEARQVKTFLHMALAAADTGGKYRVWVDSVRFPDSPEAVEQRIDGEPEPIRAGKFRLPNYPDELQARGLMATILLAIRVTPEGTAGDVVAVRSMYYDFGERKWRSPKGLKSLESNAVNSARHWTFKVPPAATRTPDQMTVVVPVHYTLGYDLNTPGVWVKVQRTPQRAIGWLPLQRDSIRLGIANSSGGDVSQYGSGPTLLGEVAGVPLL